MHDTVDWTLALYVGLPVTFAIALSLLAGALYHQKHQQSLRMLELTRRGRATAARRMSASPRTGNKVCRKSSLDNQIKRHDSNYAGTSGTLSTTLSMPSAIIAATVSVIAISAIIVVCVKFIKCYNNRKKKTSKNVNSNVPGNVMYGMPHPMPAHHPYMYSGNAGMQPPQVQHCPYCMHRIRSDQIEPPPYSIKSSYGLNNQATLDMPEINSVPHSHIVLN